jgi:hypothetical protein
VMEQQRFRTKYHTELPMDKTVHEWYEKFQQNGHPCTAEWTQQLRPVWETFVRSPQKWFLLMRLHQGTCVHAPCAAWFTTAATKDREGRQLLLSTMRSCNVYGMNMVTGLASVVSPRVDISSTFKVGQKLGVSLPLLRCPPFPLHDHPTYCTIEFGNLGGTYELPHITDMQYIQKNAWVTLPMVNGNPHSCTSSRARTFICAVTTKYFWVMYLM